MRLTLHKILGQFNLEFFIKNSTFGIPEAAWFYVSALISNEKLQRDFAFIIF